MAGQQDEIVYTAPDGYDLAGFWCSRGGGHLSVYACTSESVPLFAQVGWARDVRHNIEEKFGA